MLYEKKENSNQYLTIVNIGLVTVIVLELLFIYAPAEFWGPIKFIDSINVIAQAATAGAFVFAILQYKKNKEGERQKVLVDECRALIDRMRHTAQEFERKCVLDLEEMDYCLDRICSFAGNFDEIFRALDDDIHKAVVRMHWQDMYFLEFRGALQQITTSKLLQKYGVSPEKSLAALSQMKFSFNTFQVTLPKVYASYYKNQYVLAIPKVQKELHINGDDRNRLFIFEHLFFNDQALSDHLFGVMNRIDIRSWCPAIAALNDVIQFEGAGRDRDEFKKHWHDGDVIHKEPRYFGPENVERDWP